MRILDLDKEVLIYNSIDNLPIDQYNKFQRLQIIESGLGTDLNSIDQQYQRLAAFLEHDKKESALQEILNIRHSLYNIGIEWNVKHLSFACMVHSIDNQKVIDYSDDNLLQITKQLATLGLTQANLYQVMSEVKKN